MGNNSLKLFSWCVILFCSSLFAKDFLVDEVKVHISGVNVEDKVLIDLECHLDGANLTENSIINYFYDTGFYSNVSLLRVDSTLNLFLENKPLIKNIKIYGDKNKSNIFHILNKNGIKVGSFYDLYLLNVFKQSLQQYYANLGKHSVNIDLNVVANIDGIDLIVNISCHTKQVVKTIKIIGNNSFDENVLLKLLSHSKTNLMSWLSNDDVYMKGKLMSDLDELRSYYMDKGYIHFYVDLVKVVFNDDRTSVSIFISLNEGEKYSIGDINLVCDDKELYNNLKSIVYSNINVGHVFSSKRLSLVRKIIKDYLNSRGDIDTLVDISLNDIGKNKVFVDIFINKSSKLFVKKINFVGNLFTADYVLRRYIPQIERSYISYDVINFGKEEIIRNGFASNVTVDYVYDAFDDNVVDIVYKVDEHKTTKFLAGCSYSYSDGFILNIGAEFSNFLGNGKDVVFNVNSNKFQSEYTFGYFNPYLTNDGVGVGYNINYKSEQLDRIFGHLNHNASTFGASLYYSFKIGKYKKINFMFGCDMTKLKMYEDAASVEVRDFISREGLDFKEYYLNFVFIYNSLDKFVFPNYGLYQHFSTKITVPGSSIMYYVLNYDVSYYNQISSEYVFNLTSSLGYGNKYGDTFRYPFYKNFFIRGHNCIRGYKDKTLGPRDSNGENLGGNFLINFKASLYFQVPILSDDKNIRTSLFFDSGQVYDTFNDDKDVKSTKFLKVSSSLRYSIGFSLVWNTPFGIPFEISLAYPLNLKNTDKRSIFFFNLGMQST